MTPRRLRLWPPSWCTLVHKPGMGYLHLHCHLLRPGTIRTVHYEQPEQTKAYEVPFEKLEEVLAAQTPLEVMAILRRE